MDQSGRKIVITVPRSIEPQEVSRAINMGLMANQSLIQEMMQDPARRGKPRHINFIIGDPTLARTIREILVGCPTVLTSSRQITIVFNASNVRSAVAVGQNTLLYYVREEELAHGSAQETQIALARMAADHPMHVVSTQSLVGKRDVLPTFANLFIEVELRLEVVKIEPETDGKPSRTPKTAPVRTEPQAKNGGGTDVVMRDSLGRGPRLAGRDSASGGDCSYAVYQMRRRTGAPHRRWQVPHFSDTFSRF